MRDLKHLIFFENLLDNADNELVEKAKADGGLAIGYTCFHIPEVLLNVGQCFSVRLRAPRTGSVDIATYYMSNYTCEFARALVERGIEGGFNFLDGLAGVDACSMMNRFYEHFELLKMNDKPNMFVTHCDMPYKVVDYSVRHYVKQMQIRLLDVMKEHYGVDISDTAIREPDPKPWYRARVAVVGSEIDDPGLIQMIEEAGAMVVADRFCYGSFPGREVIELKDDEPALEQICRHYMEVSECARYISDEKVQQRRDTADRLAREFNADGIIYEQMKYCDFWGFERALVSHIMSEERGWPVLSIDRLYNNKTSGQLRTRFQAFVESLEIKRIQKKGGRN